MKTYYALIDWDGTIRNEFTILSWTKFLVENKIISELTIKDLENLFNSYSMKQITHDQLAEQSAYIYAQYLQGANVYELQNLAGRFIESDRFNLIAVSLKLLSYLTRKGVNVIVISGAPQEILVHYKQLFSLYSVYGLELEQFQERYSSKIISNPGISETKKIVVKGLIKRQEEIKLAIGNSESDIPLFEAASIRIVVNNSTLNINRNLFELNNENELKNIIDVLETRILK